MNLKEILEKFYNDEMISVRESAYVYDKVNKLLVALREFGDENQLNVIKDFSKISNDIFDYRWNNGFI